MSNVLRCCLACDYQIKTYQSPEDEYQEVTVCPKCNGDFVDVWHLSKYKNQKHNDNNPLEQKEAKYIKGNKITLVDGSTDIVIGEVRLFNGEGNGLLAAGKSYFNMDKVLSVKPIDIEVCPNELIIKHIKEIDNTVNELRKQSLDRTDSYCSLMQAKSMALLALSHTPPYQK